MSNPVWWCDDHDEYEGPEGCVLARVSGKPRGVYFEVEALNLLRDIRDVLLDIEGGRQ